MSASHFASLASVRTWADFLAADGVTDVVEDIDLGPTDSKGCESIALRVDFRYRGEPCSRMNPHYVSASWPDPIWDCADPHTAMVEKLRAETVAWVADWHKDREPVGMSKLDEAVVLTDQAWAEAVALADRDGITPQQVVREGLRIIREAGPA